VFHPRLPLPLPRFGIRLYSKRRRLSVASHLEISKAVATGRYRVQEMTWLEGVTKEWAVYLPPHDRHR